MRAKPAKVRKPVYKKGYRPPFQMNRMHWVFHEYDVDPFPSVPHGHSINSSHKLEVYTGKIYKGKNVWGAISKKEYERLWNDPLFNKYVEKAKQFHERNEMKAPKGRFGHRRRAPRRIRTLFTFTCEVEIYHSKE